VRLQRAARTRPRARPNTQPCATAPQTKQLLRCFGSQALLTGVSIGIGRWDARGYKVWMACILPFFAFDAAAFYGGFLTTAGAVGDAVGNVAFIALSLMALKGKKSGSF